MECEPEGEWQFYSADAEIFGAFLPHARDVGELFVCYSISCLYKEFETKIPKLWITIFHPRGDFQSVSGAKARLKRSDLWVISPLLLT